MTAFVQLSAWLCRGCVCGLWQQVMHDSESALLTDLEESTNISSCLLDLTQMDGQKLNTNNGRRREVTPHPFQLSFPNCRPQIWELEFCEVL